MSRLDNFHFSLKLKTSLNINYWNVNNFSSFNWQILQAEDAWDSPALQFSIGLELLAQGDIGTISQLQLENHQSLVPREEYWYEAYSDISSPFLVDVPIMIEEKLDLTYFLNEI